MKINVKEKYIVVELKETKNEDFKILVVGAKDFSGTMSFLYSPKDFSVDLKERDEVELDYKMQIALRKSGSNYEDVIENKRLKNIKVVGGK